MARRKSETPDEKPGVVGTITWLGEGEDGPRVNEWNGYKFKVGEPVDVTSTHMVKKAKNNRFYHVVEAAEPEAAE